MKKISGIALAFALAMLSGACGGNRMALVPRRERMTEGVTS
jgi:hypothetical protein